MLSGYRLMWVVVMFDLPVVAKAERKAATEFRNGLLDAGFDFDAIRSRVMSLNEKIADKLTEIEIMGTILVTVSKAMAKR